MLSQAIKNFPKQFSFEPIIENKEGLKSASKFVVAGMGGSNHATDVLKAWKPELDIIVHRDYGLPIANDLKNRFVIACSYSGNTEETIDSFNTAVKNNLSVAVIAKGGKLIDLAKKHIAPYIVLPDTGIQPRSAIGFMFMALLKIMGDEADLKEASRMVEILQPVSTKIPGRELANKLKGYAPVIYASSRNYAVANNWKVKFTENTKIPAFMNIFPELNHHEMNGFDAAKSTRELTAPFHFIFLRDDEDNPRVIKRMAILQKMYTDRELPVEVINLTGQSRLEKIFSSLLLADWTSLALAEIYGIDPEPTPMVEEFKKLIA
ncbi:MAG: Bifunctional phosphoglucose/phosphomannose isomerase [Parcubacteria group bacterium GW2011_GWA2_46_9]|nr:MAG: Bifunctional phosphoglucose/phosphomannose isomerase [Parcubacteria group bacterium GW2011_GWA2_46_9]